PGAWVLTLRAGFLCGTWVAAAVVPAAATVGALAIFLAARYAVGDLLLRKAGPFVQKMEAGFRENAFSYMMFLRLVPAFPFWLVNLVPAFLNVTVPVYAVATFFGILPGTIVYSSIGSGLGQVIQAGGTPNLGIMEEPHVLGTILGLAVLSLLPIAYKKIKARGKSAS
ncbi:MAG: VTT domain-containing protein, partial [Rhodospirillaceae bacterium]